MDEEKGIYKIWGGYETIKLKKGVRNIPCWVYK